MCENTKRVVRWKPPRLILAGAMIFLLQGCADYLTKTAHLKDNPMDQAIATGIESDHMKETRDRLLKRYPIGQPVASIKRYLESVGAECRESSGADETVTCRYSQYRDLVFRTPVAEFLEIRDIYIFRIDLMHQRDLLREVRVCRQITVIWSKGTLSDRRKREEYPMKCPEGQNSKGK